ncbi:hypothetical protein M436DRAFT_66953 [Aureobasidium namibiae CBS 147.97]|uniref:C3H1-type domain-containing protein n=1 Tax=Aureobasidium namibiae CBS 147.97 TaxID=1043004 RepID=A0A074W9Y0_9PEZI
MDLRQYLIAPHERPTEQPARHDTPDLHSQYQPTTNTLDPRLAHRTRTNAAANFSQDQPVITANHARTEIGDYKERIRQLQLQQLQLQQRLQLQQQPQQQSRNGTITREQVINGLTAYPDILAAILRSGHVPIQTHNDSRASRQHADTPPLSSQPTTMTMAQRTTIPPSHQIIAELMPTSTTPSSPVPPTNQAPSSVPTVAKTGRVCFWYYHHGNCTNDSSSPTYKPSDRACRYLHSIDDTQEIQVQQGQGYWHRGMGDCGLELCKFSSNYKYADGNDAKTQRKGEKKGKKQVEAAPSADAAEDEENVDENDSVFESKAEDPDAVDSTSQSILESEERENQDTVPTSLDPVTLSIPTSPRAGRYAKGSRRQQPPTSSPTLPTLKRKANASSQNTPTPAPKRPKTTAPIPSTQTTDPTAVTTPLSKKALKRLKRLNKKAQALITGTVVPPPSTTVSTNPTPTPKACEIIPSSLPSSHPSSLHQPASSRPSLTNKSFMVKRIDHNKPHHTTCFAWYHGSSCTKKGRNCKELHALTQPPSFVVAPVGFVHEGGVCGLEWCSGDWRGVEEGEEGEEGEEEEKGEGYAKEKGDGDVKDKREFADGIVEQDDDAEMRDEQVDDEDDQDVDSEDFDAQESADEMVD